jgi:hypothetical protein
MTKTRSPGVVPTQLSRMRDALGQYGLAYGLALALVAFVVITTKLIGPDFGYVSQPGDPSLLHGRTFQPRKHLVTDVCNRHCSSPHIYGARDRHFLVWRASGYELAAGNAKRAKRRGAGGARTIYPRHRAGRHDRDRRAGRHAVIQRGGRAAVRLWPRGGDRQKHQDDDAVAPTGKTTMAISLDICARESVALSASAAWLSASAGMDRPFRWSFPSVK